jgi:large conductance mechanosensitive channel
MGMLKEFRDFAMRGNVIDMAVGIIIGAAFGKIVSSMVNDVIMPPIGLLLGKMDFSKLTLTLMAADPAVEGSQPVVIRYGLFINTVLDFVIVAFCIFIVIKQLNRFKRKEVAAPAAPTSKECTYCFSSIPIKAKRCPQCTSQL